MPAFPGWPAKLTCKVAANSLPICDDKLGRRLCLPIQRWICATLPSVRLTERIPSCKAQPCWAFVAHLTEWVPLQVKKAQVTQPS